MSAEDRGECGFITEEEARKFFDLKTIDMAWISEGNGAILRAKLRLAEEDSLRHGRRDESFVLYEAALVRDHKETEGLRTRMLSEAVKSYNSYLKRLGMVRECVEKVNVPKYIVIHTAAHGNVEEDFDTSVEQIDEWHRSYGWNGIGYHYVIRKSGVIEKGREDNVSGAHAYGLNSRSLGICFSGNGDFFPPTEAQFKCVVLLCRLLMVIHKIPVRNVLGHREIDQILGVPEVKKTCPGLKVDMNEIRSALQDER